MSFNNFNDGMPPTKSTVMVGITDPMAKGIKDALAQGVIPADQRDIYREALQVKGKINVTDVEEMCRYLTRNRSTCAKLLGDMLDEATFYFAEGDQPEARDRANETVPERIRNNAHQLTYAKITANVDAGVKNSKGEFGSIGRELKQMNNQLLSVVNLLFTIGCGFAFGFVASYITHVEVDHAVNVLWGIGVAVLVAFAELYFLMRYFYHQDKMDEKKEI